MICFHPVYDENEANIDGTNSHEPMFPPQLPDRSFERMWAGGSISFRHENPLVLDQHIRQLTVNESVERKTGKSGIENIFLWQRREISNEWGLSVTDKVCRVFRQAGSSGKTKSAPGKKLDGFKPDFQDSFVPSILTLFRFSALTFNAHKIHFDPVYTTQIEKRPGLVVHGPLLALILIRLADKQSSSLKSFDYRALQTMYTDQKATFAGKWLEEGKKAEMYALNAAGEVCMSGVAVFE